MEVSYKGMEAGHCSIIFGSETQITMMYLGGDLACLASKQMNYRYI